MYIDVFSVKPDETRPVSWLTSRCDFPHIPLEWSILTDSHFTLPWDNYCPKLRRTKHSRWEKKEKWGEWCTESKRGRGGGLFSFKGDTPLLCCPLTSCHTGLWGNGSCLSLVPFKHQSECYRIRWALRCGAENPPAKKQIGWSHHLSQQSRLRCLIGSGHSSSLTRCTSYFIFRFFALSVQTRYQFWIVSRSCFLIIMYSTTDMSQGIIFLHKRHTGINKLFDVTVLDGYKLLW